MLGYKEACTLGMGLILCASSFIIGVFYANQTYDYRLLFPKESTQADFDNALRHYQTISKTPVPVLVPLGVVTAIGLIGHLIRIYKPNPDLRNFEYASLGLYFFGICVFLTNIKTGLVCSNTHEWGEVTENQGLAVLGSSNIILIIFFIGVLLLQGGLWYTHWDHQVRLKKFYEEEARDAEKRRQAAQEKAKAAEEAEASQEILTEKAQKNVKGSLSERAENLVERAKTDPNVEQAEDYYENKMKSSIKKGKDNADKKAKSRRNKKKE
ncbi:SHR3 (YDL212W) [Zygosaccharomyces parabailii]|nr:SHR3 (YDL212W) [Zygosaccharomyces parabailii]